MNRKLIISILAILITIILCCSIFTIINNHGPEDSVKQKQSKDFFTNEIGQYHLNITNTSHSVTPFLIEDYGILYCIYQKLDVRYIHNNTANVIWEFSEIYYKAFNGKNWSEEKLLTNNADEQSNYVIDIKKIDNEIYFLIEVIEYSIFSNSVLWKNNYGEIYQFADEKLSLTISPVSQKGLSFYSTVLLDNKLLIFEKYGNTNDNTYTWFAFKNNQISNRTTLEFPTKNANDCEFYYDGENIHVTWCFLKDRILSLYEVYYGIFYDNGIHDFRKISDDSHSPFFNPKICMIENNITICFLGKDNDLFLYTPHNRQVHSHRFDNMRSYLLTQNTVEPIIFTVEYDQNNSIYFGNFQTQTLIHSYVGIYPQNYFYYEDEVSMYIGWLGWSEFGQNWSINVVMISE